MGSQSSSGGGSFKSKKVQNNNQQKNHKAIHTSRIIDISGLSSSEAFTDSRSCQSMNTDKDSSKNGPKINGNEEKAKNNLKKIATRFEWRGEGNKVQLTGSFSQWNQLYEMNKTNEGFFELILYLPIGIYQYKFIIDGNRWECSPNDQQIKDNKGNRNNIIDNSIYIKNNINNYNESNDINIKNNNCNDNQNNNNETNNKSTACSQASSSKEKVSTKQYGNIYPPKEYFNSDAPPLPKLYLSLRDLNKNMKLKKIGRDEYLNVRRLQMNNTFKNIESCGHIYLNHILTPTNKTKRDLKNKNIQENNDNTNYNETYYRINTTMRVKTKYLSLIYCQNCNNYE